jgi:hypothetical protein
MTGEKIRLTEAIENKSISFAGFDNGYEDRIPSFGNLLLIELTNLY